MLHEKSLDFAVRIVNFNKYLREEKKEFVISKQILRSGTSIGANVRESRNAQTDPDYLTKINRFMGQNAGCDRSASPIL